MKKAFFERGHHSEWGKILDPKLTSRNNKRARRLFGKRKTSGFWQNGIRAARGTGLVKRHGGESAIPYPEGKRINGKKSGGSTESPSQKPSLIIYES